MLAHQASMPFPIGEPNDAFAQYFVGRSYLAPVSLNGKRVFNVTFEPGCRNNWHIHHAEMGGGQILICVAGRGCYQERGKEVIHMKPGDAIEIPAGVEHWHGAVPDSWFSRGSIRLPASDPSMGSLWALRTSYRVHAVPWLHFSMTWRFSDPLHNPLTVFHSGLELCNI